ncbi:MAG: hypothetical protein AAF307_01690 [Pseudomonadota bacterium]
MPSNAPIAMLAPLPALNKRTRLAKITKVLRARGHRLRFFGWERAPGELDRMRFDDRGVEESTLMRGGGYASSRARLFYPLWMMLVFVRVLRLGRGQTVFALGWETAFPALLAAMVTRSQIIFDDADRFSMILKLPGPLHRGLVRLERWTSRRAALHIVPGYARYEWRHERMIVLRNSPLAQDLEDARAAPPTRPDAALVLYANGWIGETRGAPVFLRALDHALATGLDLRLVVAGRVDGQSAPKLLAHPLVHYVGEVSQREALGWYAVSDAVLTYYDPAVPINRNAESNKWGDAVFFGCPIIVNAEVKTASAFVDGGAAWAVPYHDHEGLVALCERALRAAEMRAQAVVAVRSMAVDYPVFDDQLATILRDVLPETPS